MQAAKSIQKRGSFISGFKKHWRLLVFALPALVYIIIFHYLPMYGIVIAFEDFKPYIPASGARACHRHRVGGLGRGRRHD